MPVVDEDEAALIARVQGGDLDAFDAIVRRYVRLAYRIAYRVVGHAQDAEDLVQDAFMAALSRIETFDRTRRFGPWLYRIVVNRGINHRRLQGRRRNEELLPEMVAAREVGPARAAEQEGLRAAVADALAALPERQRWVVQLFDLDGFSGKEIAAMLGIPAGTVRWHLHEGRRALRAKLASFQETD